MQPIVSAGKFDTEINKLVTNAQVIKKNAASLKNKDDVKQLNTKIKHINKEIQHIRSSIKSERFLNESQKAELYSRLKLIQENLPSLDYLKQLGKTLSSKAAKSSAPAPVMGPRIHKAPPAPVVETTLMAKLPIDLRKHMLRFALEADPSIFMEKFRFAVPPHSIAREDAIKALRLIERDPDLANEINEKTEKGYSPEMILHEFFTERMEKLISDGKLDVIKDILTAQRPIFALDNVEKMMRVPSIRIEMENMKKEWEHYHTPAQLSTPRSRIPLTGTFTYEVFKQNQNPAIRNYCIDRFIEFSEELSRFHDYQLFDQLLDLKRPNSEIMYDVRDYLDGLIQSAHIRGDINLLEVNDALRAQMAFARIRRSVSAIEDLLIQINDKTTSEFRKSELMQDLERENQTLQDYLSGSWSRLGEMCKSNRELEKQFALLEAELFNLGHRLTPKA